MKNVRCMSEKTFLCVHGLDGRLELLGLGLSLRRLGRLRLMFDDDGGADRFRSIVLVVATVGQHCAVIEGVQASDK